MASAAEPPGVPHMPLHRPKRLKIDVACDTCRARKVKCDGARPACGNCSKRFVQRDKCRYSSNDRKPASTGGDNPRLLASHVLLAAREPEPPSSAFVATPFSAAPTVHVLPPVVASLRPRSASGSGGERPLAPHVVTSSEVPQEEQPDTSPSVIDSMTAVVDDGVSTEEYFGSSSAGSFTAQIKAAIGIRLGKTKPTSSPSTSNPGLANITAARRKGMLSTAHDVLPPRRQADHLMNVYWHYIHSLYPFLDRRKWERSYSALFAGTPLDTDERIFVATLDIIFALATQLVESLSSEQRNEASDVYFGRAQELLDLNLWDQGSLELIQYLLLTSQYLQSTNHPHQTWMVVGSAVRIAQSLGLHLPETSAAQAISGRRELMRLVWHGCVLMDRMVSLTHGRPAMVSEQLALAVPLPSLVSSPVAEGMGPSVEVSFFVKSVELYEITHKVILSLYSGLRTRASRTGVPQDKQAVDLPVLIQLDGDMSRWDDDLPEYLIPSHHDITSNKHEVLHRQAVILRIRFLHARMFLLRPALARMCLPQGASESPRPGDSLQNRVMQQCAHFCVETAQSIIGLILEHQTSGGPTAISLLPAWWYRVYYIFSAATVLIAAKLRPDLFPSENVLKAWNRAMGILKSLGQLAPSANRCVVALQILSSKIIQNPPEASTPAPAATPSQNVGPDGQPPEEAQDSPAEQKLQPFPDLDLADVTFDVDDFSWLDDMNAWGLVNE